jgi:hypothetical protein
MLLQAALGGYSLVSGQNRKWTERNQTGEGVRGLVERVPTTTIPEWDNGDGNQTCCFLGFLDAEESGKVKRCDDITRISQSNMILI